MTRLFVAVVAAAFRSEFLQSVWLIWQLAETCLLYGTFAVMTLYVCM